MKRLLTLCWAVCGTLAMLMVFRVSNEAEQLESDLKTAQRTILQHQEAIHVLQAEWSYLNRPAEIADLAKRHLDLKPLSAEQFVDLDHLPPRHTVSSAPGQPGSPSDVLIEDLHPVKLEPRP